MINIVLADDYRMVGQGLKEALSAEPDFKVVAQAGDGSEAIELVARLKPDVVVLGLFLEKLGGLSVIRSLLKYRTDMGIVIHSSISSQSYVLEALRSGAQAYVLKDSGLDELVLAIRAVSAGRRYLCSSLFQNAIDYYASLADQIKDPLENISKRQMQILQLMADGKSNAEIGAALNISSRTVEAHRYIVTRRLGVSPSELLPFVLANGIMSTK